MINKISCFVLFANGRPRGYGHSCYARAIGLQDVIGCVGALLLPPFGEAQGSSVPISRGSPPILCE